MECLTPSDKVQPNRCQIHLPCIETAQSVSAGQAGGMSCWPVGLLFSLSYHLMRSVVIVLCDHTTLVGSAAAAVWVAPRSLQEWADPRVQLEMHEGHVHDKTSLGCSVWDSWATELEWLWGRSPEDTTSTACSSTRAGWRQLLSLGLRLCRGFPMHPGDTSLPEAASAACPWTCQ